MEKPISYPLRGIIPPLVTPLLNNDTLDVEGLERLIEHTISGGVHGIFILGTTGEFAGLSYKLRKELTERTCQLVNGRVPVLVGVTDSAFTESLNLAKVAVVCGADAVVLAPPFYFASAQPELLEYLQHITVQMPLPLFIYNMPVHTKVIFSPETVKAAANIPGIVGMKDSSSNLAYFKQVQYALRDREDFTFMVGPEEFMSEFVLTGGHGGVNGGANMFPKLYVELYNASVARDFEKITPLQQKVMQVSTTIYNVGHYGSSYMKGLKCALSVMGICSDFMAEPFHRFKEPERLKIEQLLDQLNYKELL
ncbi:MAG: dihydrodipicolinate synthase family protein [Bacteroidetes bacterium GWF2_42_66]|nr:MAG: dihydrodipicolinate synthase family protein [Bacteroidetes bacterium GWA2_42_15]OFY00383.1 MAG: dihydrodipicolinate synthase family protein [Bacteroidetes bacterium GWE2_42_39]OFY47047.1 MAG: dihydrodipicolinate synthase family protein [Bacteroidetes bacterium GWF2_42_66]HBL76791.1 dihydrodipicolinate synthase family protein [Prolixibacteraceae bacterium]HCU62828.1 dihydrodipicolinate synthase family protein [Prolixibacteraceae bacterium]